MIDSKYLCDYNIKVPIFSEDPTNKNICEYLIKNYRNIIIYCNSHIEGNTINNLMNTIQPNCSKYIDCNTNKNERNKIINEYKKRILPFLVNVKILVEGFDAPITNGVCFMHLPSSKTTIIQIIGRALRIYPNKTFANIILPFSNYNEKDNINKFIKIICNNDIKIKKSYVNKKIGGYIELQKIYKEDNTINNVENTENVENDIEFKYELIYDKLGNNTNSMDIWEKNLCSLKTYIDKYKKLPSSESKNYEIRKIAIWKSKQNKNYKKNQYNMLNDFIKNKWINFISDNKYKKYFMSNEDIWNLKLNRTKLYIDEHNERPSKKDKNIDIQQLANWISEQQATYRKNKSIMKNIVIRKKWEDFTLDEKYKKYFISDEKYKKHFISNDEDWKLKLDETKKYIDKYKKRPREYDKNIEIKKLAKWLHHQIYNYKKYKAIMNNENIRKEWEIFLADDKYKNLFN